MPKEPPVVREIAARATSYGFSSRTEAEQYLLMARFGHRIDLSGIAVPELFHRYPVRLFREEMESV